MDNKSFIFRFIGHLNTITKHKILVQSMCFKCGMIKQGILHDLSKYSPSEFWPSVKYFQGNRSPISYEKEIKGYSECWLHHKGRNKHHWEYWIDRRNMSLYTNEMPLNYVLESVLDRIAASKVYNKNDYSNESTYLFYIGSKEYHVMNKNNVYQIETLLKYLKDNGEKDTLKYIANIYKKWRKDKTYRI